MIWRKESAKKKSNFWTSTVQRFRSGLNNETSANGSQGKSVGNMVRVRCGHLSITGKRDNNEDNYVVDEHGRFFIVADGMGGQSAGERASSIAVEVVPKELSESLSFDDDESSKVVEIIDGAVARANEEIMRLGKSDAEMHNMGTTITFVVVIGHRLFIGGVGDSRVYQLREGEFRQLTTDHSLTQALVEAGTITPEEATKHRYRNVLYRYLGAKEGAQGTDPKELHAKPGDRYLLCSDGVTDGASNEVLSKCLAEIDDPQEAANQCVKLAEAGGSKDNITAVVLHVDES